jgi:hypothetical protein
LLSRWRIVGSDGSRIALVTPSATVIAEPVIRVEVAILIAGVVVGFVAALARNAAVERVFGVVARPNALRIGGVDESVAIVVLAVSTEIQLLAALRFDALPRVTGSSCLAATSSVETRTRVAEVAASGKAGRTISADFDRALAR